MSTPKVNLNTRNSLTWTYYKYFFKDLGDPRTHNWPLMANPFPAVAILAFYLYFILKWGPRYMRNREPFDLRSIIKMYNFTQIFMSLYIGIKGFKYWFFLYSWKCEPIDFSNSPEALGAAHLCYAYFIVKLTELFDTVFFVLRKKNKQISLLHIYHHALMPMVGWGATKYVPGGHGTFIGFINSWVHVFMYTYYFLAAFGPTIRKYLWWKKYITIFQLFQFVCQFLHSLQLLFYDCGYPRWTIFATLPNILFFYKLFMDFYKESYNNKKAEKKSEPKSN